MRYTILVLLIFTYLKTTSNILNVSITKESNTTLEVNNIPNLDIDSILELDTVRSKQSIAWRYKNPGNLRSFYTGEYRKFNSIKDGFEAMKNQIYLYITTKSNWTDSSTTINDFVYKVYANETTNLNYIKTLTKNLKVNRDILICKLNVDSLQKYLIYFEDNKLYKKIYEQY